MKDHQQQPLPHLQIHPPLVEFLLNALTTTNRQFSNLYNS